VALTPVNGIECGLPAASSVITRVADFVPKVCGENVTLIVQFVPPARVEDETGQVVVSEKSPAFIPLKAMLLMVSPWLPASRRLKVWATLVLTA